MKIAYPYPLSLGKVAVSGGGVHVRQFLRTAAKQGHEVLTFGLLQGEDAPQIPGDRLERLRVLRTVDAIYYRTEGGFASPAKWFTFPYYSLIGQPTVVWEFNTLPDYLTHFDPAHNLIGPASREFMKHGRRCDLAICVSNALSDYVQEKFGIRNVTVIPNGADPDLFTRDLNPPERIKFGLNGLNVVLIGSSGSIDFVCLKEVAIKLWKEEFRDISFHILGDASALSGILPHTPPNVCFHGQVSYAEIPSWLSVMNVGLILYAPGPANFGSPMRLFDYLASGLVIAGTEQAQVREVCAELGHSDFIVPAGRSDELVDVLIHLRSNPGLVASLGEAGRRLVRNKYTWRHNVDKTFRAIERVHRAHRLKTHARKEQMAR